MHTDSEDKALAGFSNKTPRRKAEKTGRYRNASTMHEARFKAGATLPPGYEPASDEQPADPDADPATHTITVETPEAFAEIEKVIEAVGKRAEDAESELAEQREENKHIRGRIEQLEESAKDTTVLDGFAERLAALEANVSAGATDVTAGDAATSTGGAQPEKAKPATAAKPKTPPKS